MQGDGDVACLGLRGEDGDQGLEGPLLGDGECSISIKIPSSLRYRYLKKVVAVSVSICVWHNRIHMH